ncbi:hypothetical protein MNBD_CPR01-202 [hydrothermal vent metagenome]|uniref:Uncharacterized protein n=1 Tax=hydrothermal vent metagenome TaxID=652676 RepID=A0A3B0UKX3_9ZZZZ
MKMKKMLVVALALGFATCMTVPAFAGWSSLSGSLSADAGGQNAGFNGGFGVNASSISRHGNTSVDAGGQIVGFTNNGEVAGAIDAYGQAMHFHGFTTAISGSDAVSSVSGNGISQATSYVDAGAWRWNNGGVILPTTPTP